MTGHRHATDKTDWKVIVECPNNGDHVEGETDPDDPVHLALEASATNADPDPEDVIPFDDCPICGAPLDTITSEKPSEVLE